MKKKHGINIAHKNGASCIIAEFMHTWKRDTGAADMEWGAFGRTRTHTHIQRTPSMSGTRDDGSGLQEKKINCG